MFVPQARIKLGSSPPSWFGRRTKAIRLPKRRLKWFEFFRMPCLLPNIVGTIIGLLVICSGAILCYIGYNPDKFFNSSSLGTNTTTSNSTTLATITPMIIAYSPLRSLAYIGPILMGIGFFVLIVAVVLYCEIRDKFIRNVVPKRNVASTRKSDLYDMVIDEFRKNYFRGIEVPLPPKRKRSKKVSSEMPTLYKALSISTPALLITPEVQRRWHKDTGSSPKNKRKRRLGDNETWLKTSSMPNIRPKSFRKLQRRFSKHYRSNVEKTGIPKIEITNINEKLRNNNDCDEKTESDTCFSNPAFRSSSPETIELDDITTNIQTNSMEITNTSNVTQVAVHIDAYDEANDARGFTEKRQTDLCKGHSKSQRHKSESTSIRDNRGRYDMNPDIDSTYGGYPAVRIQKNKTRHKSFDHLDIGLIGPYKTCIGIFRSESCLHRIRNIVSNLDCGDGDDSSLDSLTLNDEMMKNFENSTS